MEGNGEARRPLLRETLSAAERSVISHPPDSITEDVEQGCVPVNNVFEYELLYRPGWLAFVPCKACLSQASLSPVFKSSGSWTSREARHQEDCLAPGLFCLPFLSP